MLSVQNLLDAEGKDKCKLPMKLPIINHDVDRNSRLTEFLAQGKSQLMFVVSFTLQEQEMSFD